MSILQNRIALAVGGVVLLMTVAAFSFLPASSPDDPELENQLILGSESLLKGQISIPLVQRESLSELMVKDILALRKQSIGLQEGLARNNYRPSPVVFGAIQNELPWYSEEGFYYGGAGSRTEGPSKESLYILNPYLLIGAEFWGVTIWDGGAMHWKSRLDTTANLRDSHFPLYPKPTKLIYEPTQQRAQVTYHFSEFLKKVDQYTSSTLPNSSIALGIVGYNARDFGFNYIGISSSSSNIDKGPLPVDPFPLLDGLEGGDKCFESSPCNARIMTESPLHSLTLKALPANLIINLWRTDPLGWSTKSDFEYSILID